MSHSAGAEYDIMPFSYMYEKTTDVIEMKFDESLEINELYRYEKITRRIFRKRRQNIKEM